MKRDPLKIQHESFNRTKFLFKAISIKHLTLPSEVDQRVGVEQKYKNVRCQVGVVYNPPTGNKQGFLDKVDSFLISFQSASKPVIVCGDFNIDVMKNQFMEEYLMFMLVMNLSK